MAGKKLKIIPLGGLGEIGKNMMALEYSDDIIVIDAGLMFPEADMLGVDLVIPDISYLVERSQMVRGILITHGHEDHTGALPYVLAQMKVPVYATKLTQGLISLKLKEHHLRDKVKLEVVQPGQAFNLGKFKVEFFRVCHSIPDAAGLIIQTPLGIVVHSGDFKLDFTPTDARPTEFSRLAQLGADGVLLLLSDSTYVELPGYTPSERVVGQNLERIMAEAPGRVIITTFASLVSRIQQVIDAAYKYNRQVFVIGRRMTEIVRMALELGYLSAPPGVLSRLEQMRHLPHNRIVLLTTGSQGEPTSALVRIANRDHPQVRIQSGDTIVISASPIPGNEGLINRTIDNLFRQGANVLYDKVAQVHVHGHGSQEELKLLISLVRPKFFVPVHGEYRHLSLHARLAQTLGIPKENAFVLEDGDILALDRERGHIVAKLPVGNVYVDGLGVGDIGHVVLRDRRMIAQDGIVLAVITVDKRTGQLVGLPDIVSRGFVDPTDAQALFERGRDLVAKALGHGDGHSAQTDFISKKVKQTLFQFFYNQTKRRPMILPVIVEV
jgi:ribonuclease J